MLIFYLQLILPIIKIVISHFVVHVGKITHDEERTKFFKLISDHIIERHDICPLAQVKKASDEITKETRLRTLDFKKWL